MVVADLVQTIDWRLVEVGVQVVVPMLATCVGRFITSRLLLTYPSSKLRLKLMARLVDPWLLVTELGVTEIVVNVVADDAEYVRPDYLCSIVCENELMM